MGRVVDRYTNGRGEYIVESRDGALRPCDDRQALAKALNAYERANLPAPEAHVYPELAALKAKTKAAQTGDEDLEFQMRIYARELQAYPGDVVMHVLRTQAGHGTFWPSWAELKERLDLYASKRRRRLAQLRELDRRTNGGPDA
jgi:hypothetical protein